MRPGREIDCAIAKDVLGYPVSVKKKELVETTPLGDRPLRRYTKDMEWTWEVVEKMRIGLIPIEGGQWFALVGEEGGWKSPADFIQYLADGKFLTAGAAVGDSAPMVVCTAALKAVENRKAKADESATVQ